MRFVNFPQSARLKMFLEPQHASEEKLRGKGSCAMLINAKTFTGDELRTSGAERSGRIRQSGKYDRDTHPVRGSELILTTSAS